MSLEELDPPVPGLRTIPAAPLPFDPSLAVRAFVLDRAAGPTVLYAAPGLEAVAAELGPPALWLLGHEHEAPLGPRDLGPGVHVHERDRAATERHLPIAGTFTHREVLGGDLEVIPIGGHTPGTTAYLWTRGEQRLLFAGDALWSTRDGWRATLLGSSDRAAYLEGLATLRELDVDVLVPWAAPADGPPVAHVTRDEARAQLDAVIARVRAGAAG